MENKGIHNSLLINVFKGETNKRRKLYHNLHAIVREQVKNMRENKIDPHNKSSAIQNLKGIRNCSIS